MNNDKKHQSDLPAIHVLRSLIFVYAVVALPAFGAETSVVAARLNALGLQAIDSGRMEIRNDSVYLFGQLTNGRDTKQGQWACAKVASIVLHQAGAMKNVVLGVNQVETSLQHWKRIDAEDSLIPGDVVVWTRRYNAGKDGACVGSGTCHVGIVTSKGYFHNDPLKKRPSIDGLSLLAFKFKYGLRPNP